MTNDRHARIYSDGKAENLPALWPCYVISPNDTENENNKRRKSLKSTMKKL